MIKKKNQFAEAAAVFHKNGNVGLLVKLSFSLECFSLAAAIGPRRDYRCDFQKLVIPARSK